MISLDQPYNRVESVICTWNNGSILVSRDVCYLHVIVDDGARTDSRCQTLPSDNEYQSRASTSNIHKLTIRMLPVC